MQQFHARPLSSAVLLAALCGACTGSVGLPDTEPAPPGGSGGAAGHPSTGGSGGMSTKELGPITSVPVEGPRLARLSHRQYENTVRDLLRMTTAPGLAVSFVTEPLQGNFDNAGGSLQVSPGLWLDYQRAAEAMAEAVVKDAKRLAAIVPANLPADPAAKARAFIESFGLRAYRRPLTAAEIDQALAFFNKGPTLVGSGNAFNDGVTLVITLFLQSPHFIYRSELGTGTGPKVVLDSYQVAAKLSYALANTMPDDALFTAAAENRLGRREEVLAHARRLLDTPDGKRMIEDYHAQLLNMVKYEHITKDTKAFPEYYGGIGATMRSETLAFVNDVVVARDKGFAELLTAPYTFVNAKLAAVYGKDITSPLPTTDKLEKVQLDPARRAGLLTHSGFLAAYADGAQPHTILRGAFVNHDLLCRELPPPPDAFTLPPQMGRTNRQRIEAATHVSGCASCHQSLINPPGFALEGYDALGRFRTMDGTLPVDARGTYVFDDGAKSFDGGVELSKHIAASQQAHDCYAKHWMEYLYGRLIEKDADKDLAHQLGRRSLQGSASVRALVMEMVATDAFLTRTP